MSIHSRRRLLRSPLVVGAVAALGAVAFTATPASANVAQVSTQLNAADVDADGFPSWYSDGTFKVELCVTDAKCLGGAQARPAEEAFYAVARAEVALKSTAPGASGGRARYRAVLEGAWASPDMLDGEQTTFVRTQVTVDKIDLQTYPPNTLLSFATPYGVLEGRVTGDPRKGRFTGKMSRDRKESALGTPDNRFTAPVTSASAAMFGPRFLRWDTDRPTGYLGDPAVLHTVTGASGTNPNAFFATGGRSDVATEFEIAGKCINAC